LPLQGKLSVRLSARPSVTMKYRGHIQAVVADPNITDLLQSQHPKILAGISRVGKIVDFRHLSHRIYETVQDRVQVAIDH